MLKESKMNNNNLDDIEALKAKQKKTELSSEEIVRLRAEVKKDSKEARSGRKSKEAGRNGASL